MHYAIWCYADYAYLVFASGVCADSSVVEGRLTVPVWHGRLHALMHTVWCSTALLSAELERCCYYDGIAIMTNNVMHGVR